VLERCDDDVLEQHGDDDVLEQHGDGDVLEQHGDDVLNDEQLCDDYDNVRPQLQRDYEDDERGDYDEHDDDVLYEVSDQKESGDDHGGEYHGGDDEPYEEAYSLIVEKPL